MEMKCSRSNISGARERAVTALGASNVGIFDCLCATKRNCPCLSKLTTPPRSQPPQPPSPHPRCLHLLSVGLCHKASECAQYNSTPPPLSEQYPHPFPHHHHHYPPQSPSPWLPTDSRCSTRCWRHTTLWHRRRIAHRKSRHISFWSNFRSRYVRVRRCRDTGG